MLKVTDTMYRKELWLQSILQVWKNYQSNRYLCIY